MTKTDKDLEQLIKEMKSRYGLFMTRKEIANLLGFKDVRSIVRMIHEIDIFEDEVHGISARYLTASVARYIHRHIYKGVIV